MMGKFHIKNYRRWISITAAAMVVIGLVIIFIGYAAGGFKVRSLFNLEETVYATETVDGSKSVVGSITIHVDTAEITLTHSGTSEFVLEYPSNRYSYKAENGQIVVDGSSIERRHPWYQAVFFSTSFDERVVVQVPNDFTGDVELQADFGKIKITEDFTLQNLTLSSKSGQVRTGRLTVNGDACVQSNFGNIHMEALHASGDVKIDSDNGRITLNEMTGFTSANLSSNFGKVEVSNVAGGLLTVQSDNGRITLNEMTGFTSANLSSNFGKVEVSNVTGGLLMVQSDNGTVKLEQVTLEEELSVKSNFGSIRCDGIFAPKISLKSDNGSIKGTIDGSEKDFDISFQTDYGSGSQSSRGSGKYSIEAVSSFGSINLEFSEQ